MISQQPLKFFAGFLVAFKKNLREFSCEKKKNTGAAPKLLNAWEN